VPPLWRRFAGHDGPELQLGQLTQLLYLDLSQYVSEELPSSYTALAGQLTCLHIPSNTGMPASIGSLTALEVGGRALCVSPGGQAVRAGSNVPALARPSLHRQVG
jgi:hypothetical protein